MREEFLIDESDCLASTWKHELDETGRIDDIDNDLADIKFLSVRDNKDVTEILQGLAFGFLEKLEWN